MTNYLDYTITWKYICDEMHKRYGISPRSKEKFSMKEIKTYIDKIWNDFALEKDIEYIRLRRDREEAKNDDNKTIS